MRNHCVSVSHRTIERVIECCDILQSIPPAGDLTESEADACSRLDSLLDELQRILDTNV